MLYVFRFIKERLFYMVEEGFFLLRLVKVGVVCLYISLVFEGFYYE